MNKSALTRHKREDIPEVDEEIPSPLKLSASSFGYANEENKDTIEFNNCTNQNEK